MSAPATIWVVLPAYNEAGGLDELLRRWQSALDGVGRPHRLIVVDDGSSDRTPQILREWEDRAPLTVITHERNMGLGVAMADGLRAAAEAAQPGDVIVTMDADNTHPPEILPDVLARMESEGADVVIASRYRKGSKVTGLSPLRRAASTGARVLYKALFPIRGVRDYTCGYRAYRAECLQRAAQVYGDRLIQEDGFEATAGLLLRLRPLGLRFAEVPFVLRYDRKEGASKMRMGRTIWRSLRLLLARRLRPTRNQTCPPSVWREPETRNERPETRNRR